MGAFKHEHFESLDLWRDASLLWKRSSITQYSRVISCIFCLRPKISHFSKKSGFLLVTKCVSRPQSGARNDHCYYLLSYYFWIFSVDKFYYKLCVCVCIYMYMWVYICVKYIFIYEINTSWVHFHASIFILYLGGIEKGKATHSNILGLPWWLRW